MQDADCRMRIAGCGMSTRKMLLEGGVSFAGEDVVEAGAGDAGVDFGAWEQVRGGCVQQQGATCGTGLALLVIENLDDNDDDDDDDEDNCFLQSARCNMYGIVRG